jgi:hypothetical protein
MKHFTTVLSRWVYADQGVEKSSIHYDRSVHWPLKSAKLDHRDHRDKRMRDEG